MSLAQYCDERNAIPRLREKQMTAAHCNWPCLQRRKDVRLSIGYNLLPTILLVSMSSNQRKMVVVGDSSAGEHAAG